jgi:hypothetical protein
MLWLNPTALFALAAIAAPILIHILIQRRAERLPFPTLRFLQPTRLAAIRRHLLEDLPLLAVRAALLAAAAAALAGPLLVTASRRQAWDRRVVRAVVADDGARAVQASDTPLLQQRFDGSSLRDGIRRAIVWLETTPPARRELVIDSPLPIGSITAADIAQIPAHIGVRFKRHGSLPATRAAAAGRLLTRDGVRAREVILDADRTSVRDAATAEAVAWPIDVIASPADQPAADAAIAAVRAQRVWAAPADRRVRLVLVPARFDHADQKVATASESQADLKAGAASESQADLKARAAADTASDVVQAFRPAVIAEPWMADAIARVAADRGVGAAAVRVASGLSDARFTAAPWQRIASAGDGRALVVAAAAADRLLIVTAAPASDIATPLLVRSIANGIASRPDLQSAEVTPIPDAVLERWSRPAPALAAPRVETVDRDDRRWLWLAVLGLLALEVWMRRARTDAAAGIDQETTRVA